VKHDDTDSAPQKFNHPSPAKYHWHEDPMDIDTCMDVEEPLDLGDPMDLDEPEVPATNVLGDQMCSSESTAFVALPTTPTRAEHIADNIESDTISSSPEIVQQE
jgi:hypothetical protein